MELELKEIKGKKIKGEFLHIVYVSIWLIVIETAPIKLTVNKLIILYLCIYLHQ